MSFTHSQITQRKGFLIRSSLFPLHSSLHSSSSPPLPNNSDYPKQSTPSSSSSKISPAILFIVVILAVIFFIAGLVHLLVRFLMKQRSSSSSSISESNSIPPELSESASFRRQLQQLFQLHDSGLDQAFIDALPVFLYKEIMGLQEPFDCAVCLCEFSEQDKLRLLPMCSHAFHIDCIDTWLLSNSTCPLCRGTLYASGLAIENLVFDFEDPREEGHGVSGILRERNSSGRKPAENEIISEKRVFSVRLGKFKNLNNGGGVKREEAETSSSNLGARRCYSMGSYQYVVADSDLVVALSTNNRDSDSSSTSMRLVKGRGAQDGNVPIEEDAEGKRIKIGSKNESFSVSKIWQWSKKGRYPSVSDTHLPWTERSQGI